MNTKIDTRNINELYETFESANTILLKKYICELEKFNVYDTNLGAIEKINPGSNICLYHIDKIVYDVKENVQDKLTTIYSSLYSDKESALVLLLKGSETKVDLYLGVVSKNVKQDGTILTKTLDNMGNTIKGVIEGHFPGTILKRIGSGETTTLIDGSLSNATTVAAVSGIAALRNRNESKNEEFVQGMEKLIDSMRGKQYTALYIADTMSISKVEALCAEYEDIYAKLSPFKQSVNTLNENTTFTDTSGLIEGIVDTTNESLAKSITKGKSHNITKTDSFGGGIHIGISADYHHSKGITEGTSESNTETETIGSAKSLTTQNSVSQALSNGTSESMQITYENRAVRTLLERIDEQIKRLRACEDFGLFDSCVYFLSNKYENAVSAASTYKSMIRGENSSVESSAINVWTECDQINTIKKYLKKFYHPLFVLNDYLNVTPALLVSGKELAFQFSLPKKSVSGLPIISCAEFGRNVMTVDDNYNGDLNIGKIYHMNHAEENEVFLSIEALTAHTFITGSTSAGKSNAVYQILDKVTMVKEHSTFMVIEPAKGEYKDIFGSRPDVSVYGTNPKMTSLLRINPFRFPATTHIYEHMNRLVEIFNMCWPMYAAMPAVLKAALEKAYVSAGWNLEKSENITGAELFPTFTSVAIEIKKYIDSSEYSDENKGNYKGALLTRLESMTNGINGMIFSSDDLTDEELFDENVIVDLSHIGSTENKALIMGILITRMQEYRSGSCLKNSKLRHVTVLEEAHNLLRRTSFEQHTEGANLIGKSVEMLSNSIAEMRTYGEAFIIVDQAPELLDMSVIRNTNTKIIFKLPDYSDRELVGKAANLDENQINELAKLKNGVSAVYQNNWLAPVLCQFEQFQASDNAFVYIKPDRRDYSDKTTVEILNIIMKSDIRQKLDDVGYETKIKRDVCISKFPDSLKVLILKYLNNDTEKSNAKYIAEIAYNFFEAENVLNSLKTADDIEKFKQHMVEKLSPDITSFNEDEISSLLALLLKEHCLSYKDYIPIYRGYMEFINDKNRVN